MLGPREGQPVDFQWHWYYNVPGLPQWILLLLMAVVPKRNRSWQAWLILLPPLALVVFWLLILVVIPDSSELDIIGQFLTAVAIAWSSVWLMGPGLLGRDRVRTFLAACAMTLAVGVVGYVGYFGFWVSAGMTWPLIGIWAISTMPLIVVTALTGWCCRGNCDPLHVLLWPMLWIPIVCGLCTAPFFVIMVVIEGGVGLSLVEMLGDFVIPGLVATVFIAGVLYVLNLPVALLCVFSPCYRERFREGFCPDNRDWMPDVPGEFTGESDGADAFRL